VTDFLIDQYSWQVGEIFVALPATGYHFLSSFLLDSLVFVGAYHFIVYEEIGPA